MITITQAVTEIIEDSPVIQEGLSLDVLNLSSVARRIQPDIEKRTMKDVSVNAVNLALQRVTRDIAKKQRKQFRQKPEIDEIELQSNMIVITLKNNTKTLSKLSLFTSTLSSDAQHQLKLVLNEDHITLVIDRQLERSARPFLSDATSESVLYGIASVDIRVGEGDATTLLTYVSNQLLWNGIKTYQTIVNNRSILLLVEADQAQRVLSVLGSIE